MKTSFPILKIPSLSLLTLIIFFLFTLFSPTQLGKHWWPSWSLVNGVRSDYLSPTLFFSDVLFIIFVILLFCSQSTRENVPHVYKNPFFLLFLFYVTVQILLQPHDVWLLSLYSIIRYAQPAAVAWACATIIKRHRPAGEMLIWGLSCATLFIVALALVQITTGKTTGILWVFGERDFNVSSPGIATLSIASRVILRPYATFPHPNALAGWLAGVMLFFVLTRSSRLMQSVALIGTVLTGSRTALFALTVSLLLSYNILSTIPTQGLHGIAFASTSFSDRMILLRASLRMMRSHPLLGVGPGQFIRHLPSSLPPQSWILQPVHNIPLLLLTEFGIVGSSILVLGLWKASKFFPLRSVVSHWKAIVTFIVLTSLLDHYWVSAQQNRILLGLLLGYWSQYQSSPTKKASLERQ